MSVFGPEMTVIRITHRTGKDEMRVAAAFAEAAKYGGDIDSVKRYFNSKLAEMSTKNHLPVANFYKLEKLGERLVLWHLNSIGDRDRKVLEGFYQNNQ